jgi:uncharacterized damage-inducible protein DinB
MATIITKPVEGEYPPYTINYIKLIPDNSDLSTYLEDSLAKVKALVGSLTKEQLLYRYAEGKWTMKDILVHIADSERIFAYRALRMSRNDTTPMPGFEENDYAEAANAADRDVRDILQEYESVKMATLSLLRSFTEADLLKKGIANNNPVSVRAVLYMIAGHEQRHLNIINERYLTAVTHNMGTAN